MKICQHNEKDIAKIFALLRTQLQAKEKELLGLQRTNPCLLAPDPDQVDILLDAIASLQLSTPEGSFVFSSDSDCDDTSSCASVCSVEFNSIKTLPSTVWLPESHLVEQQHGQRSSIADHLLSLPINAYLASSSKTQNQLIHRSPVVSDLLSMSVDAFKSSSNTSASIEIKNDKNVQNDVLPTTTGSMKNVLNNEIFSKEFWLRNN